MLKMPIVTFPVNIALLEDDVDFADLVAKTLIKETPHTVRNFYPDLEKLSNDTLRVEDLLEQFAQGEMCKMGVYQSEVFLRTLWKLGSFFKSYYPLVLSDYALDFTDGLQELNKIKDPFVQKILITNVACK